MRLSEIRARALRLGLHAKGAGKEAVIKHLQKAEGHQPCFGNNDGSCQYGDCCYWDDCLKSFLKHRVGLSV